jgi:DNA polymerase-3 subunit beta
MTMPRRKKAPFYAELPVLDVKLALQRALPFIDSGGKLPVLACVLMTAGEDRLTIEATDLHASGRFGIDMPGIAEGQVVVDAKPLTAFVATLGSDSENTLLLTGRGKGDGLIVARDGATMTLMGLPPGDFPQLQPSDGEPLVMNMPADELRDLLSRPLFAVGKEETRYHLCGVYLHRSGPGLRAVATDGHRLFCLERPMPDGVGDGLEQGAIVPTPVVKHLVRLLGAGDVRLTLWSDKIMVELATGRVISRLIDRTFPDYQRVIPTDAASEVRAYRASLLTALDRVATAVESNSDTVKLVIDEASIILSGSSNLAEASDTVTPQGHTGKTGKLGFKVRYLHDALSALTGDIVRIDWGKPNGPVLINDPDEPGVSQTLMPMRV